MQLLVSALGRFSTTTSLLLHSAGHELTSSLYSRVRCRSLHVSPRQPRRHWHPMRRAHLPRHQPPPRTLSRLRRHLPIQVPDQERLSASRRRGTEVRAERVVCAADNPEWLDIIDALSSDRQLTSLACGTQALLSILLNHQGENVKLGQELEQLKEFTADLPAEYRGRSLGNSFNLRLIHNSQYCPNRTSE